MPLQDTRPVPSTRRDIVCDHAAALERLRAEMAAGPNYPPELEARLDSLTDADQAAGMLTDLACMDETDGLTDTGRDMLRALILARFPDAED